MGAISAHFEPVCLQAYLPLALCLDQATLENSISIITIFAHSLKVGIGLGCGLTLVGVTVELADEAALDPPALLAVTVHV